MGCVQGRARKRIADARVMATAKSFELKKKRGRERKFDSQMGSLFTIVEASVSHEGSLN